MNDVELNAAVAEKVFGWTEPGAEYDNWPEWPDDPDFATDGNAMLRVIERMRERDLKLDLRVGEVCHAQFHPDEYRTMDYEQADSPPRAVALAALKAVSHEA